jgi:hypothetical protein
MNKRKMLAIALMPVALSGLLFFLIQIMVAGSGASLAFAPPVGALLRAVNETEPNDTIGTANPIDVNLTMVGAIPIAQPNDIDWYRLVLSPSDLGRSFRATLEEVLPDADYRLELNLYDSEGSLIDSASSGTTTSLDWTSSVITYYLRSRAVEFDVVSAPGDADYELTVVHLAGHWDACEINDTLTGSWSGTTPPGGPCPVSTGAPVSDLNFVPFTGQPSPNPDYFSVFVQAGRSYRLETEATAGVDTVAYLYLPGATDDAQYIATNDDAPGLGLGSRIEWSPTADGFYLVKIENREPLPHDSGETYTLTVEDLTPDILYVKPSPSGDASCSDWDNACELQTALGEATSGDEIWVQEGVYKPTNGIGYASCQEIRDALPDAPNGDYLINNGGNVFQVYCDNMDSAPVEYLTLWNQGQNYAQYTAGGASSGTDVRTHYSRVRLLPDTLQIDISDQRYSSSTGSLTHGATEVTSMPYGVAMDCLNLGSNQGVARIDLRETPLVVSDTFMTCGYYPAGSWTFSEEHQVVDLTGGGYCGWVQPAAPGCLATPFNDAGGAQPILELSYLGPERRATFQLKNGVALYGGFAGTETRREERDWETHVTVLSGDIDGDDIVDAHGVVTDTARIQGNNAYHVVVGSGVTGSAQLDGFTVTAGATATSGGCPDECGAGMLNEGGSPTIRHLTFRGNRARTAGGGMYNDGSSPALIHVSFSDNDVAYYGGGMSNRNNSRPVLVNVTFSSNGGVAGGGGMSNEQSAPTLHQVTFNRNWIQGRGGGMFNADSSPSLTRVAFVANVAVLGSGGGMYNDNSHPSLTNITFNGNHGGQDGGISNQNSHPGLTNVTFAGNVALGGGGGGMGNYNSSPTLINVTFASCGADQQGGSMYNEAGSNPTIQNSIFWHSCDSANPGKARAAITNVDSLPTIAYSLLEGAFTGGSWDASLGVDGGHNLDLAPLFACDPDPGPDGQWAYSTDNDYGDLQLQATSPAIDGGDNNALPADVSDLDGDGDLTEPCPLDLANSPRIVGGTIDLGAYEFARLLYLPLVVR